MFGKSTLDGLSEASLSASILAIVDYVVGRRRKGLSGAAAVVVPAALLRFEVNHCYFDRAAFNETVGFFDAEDLPPWDTWIAYEVATDSLVSWVPESLRALVQKGVDASRRRLQLAHAKTT
ncbi:MAG: hypothetical protein IPG50_29855 [Myxococcales bacterium]|nr:hypothetical protein [Myxococcales bacterium]